MYFVLIAAAAFACVAAFVWQGSEEYSLESASLGEVRTYRIFGGSGSDTIVYTLDGEKFRHGLFPATVSAITHFLRGDEAPAMVAIYSNHNRDIDFRNAKSESLAWRPVIAGRAEAFDQFLLEELMPEVERDWPKAPKRHLMGHSLAGLYAIDMASRQPDIFAGIYAFSPTFSHDMSIRTRIENSCANATLIYANIGLESGRDTEAFMEIAGHWKAQEECTTNLPIIQRHYGVPHAFIMISGQFEALALYLR